MGKKNNNKSPRPGSVAANRAAGTNKAAQNQAAKAAASPSPRPAPRPAPSPRPSPRPSPSPRSAPSPSPRPGSVAARRAAGTNKAAQNQAARTQPRPSPTPRPAQQVAKERAQMSTKERRAAQAESGMSMKQYKAGGTAPRATTQAVGENGGSGTSSNTFTTAAGYEMEKGAYNKSLHEMSDRKRAESRELYGNAHNDFTYGDSANYGSFDEDGYLSYDSKSPMWMNGEMLKTAGYKVGDTLWKPGAKDDLNGRELTGRIASFTQGGAPIPEYVHDAINSSHKSTGNAGYAGEVGLGADQSAYNREYERNNDVTTGQVNQQLEANGYSQEETDDYWTATNEKREQIEEMRGGSVRPEDVKPITANQDPAASGASVDNNNGVNSAKNFTNNFFGGFNPQYKTGYKAPNINDISAQYEKMGFNFDPNRFNTQGQ